MNNYIEVDADKLIDIGTKLNSELDELQKQIDEFFKKIEAIPVTGEWTGTNASSYCDKAYKDLKTYTKFVENLRNLSDEMIALGDNTNDKVRECQSLLSYEGFQSR
jgi:uncharacterized protein YukE